MIHKNIFTCLDKRLRDLSGIDIPFAGKTFVFGGDFRQVGPIVEKGSQAAIFSASILNAPFWPLVQRKRLIDNMRLDRDQRNYNEFLLRVGNGTEETYDEIGEDFIKMPEKIIVQNLHFLMLMKGIWMMGTLMEEVYYPR